MALMLLRSGIGSKACSEGCLARTDEFYQSDVQKPEK
jgi:hypothetical protein